MYSSGYSHVSKSSPQAHKKMAYRSKGKSCGYYMRIIFFFSSLIQSLIIVSLVLFLVYGKTQDSASTSRIQDLEESFSRLSIENVALRHQRKNLTNILNATVTEKARNDWDLARLRYFSNISVMLIKEMETKAQQTNRELFLCKSGSILSPNCQTQTFTGTCNCGALVEQLKARLSLVDSNFTQSAQKMTMEMDQITKERDNLHLEAIRLRREKTSHEMEAQFLKQRCKEDFIVSLSGIANVSKAFLEKIESLFPAHIAFQLSCPRQREHLEQIRTNCTSLSMEVEDKLQRYLNTVGGQVSEIQHENSRFKAENILLAEDYRRCSTNRTGMIKQHKQNLDNLQQKHDVEKERLLMDKLRLNGDIEVLKNSVKYKTKMVDHLTEQFKQLNATCMLKPGFGGFPGGLPPQTGPQSGWPLTNSGGSNPFGGVQPGRASSSTSLFSSGSSSSVGSSLNKPSTGSGSSLFSSGSSSSTGSLFNKPSTGSGSSLFSSGSSSSAGSSLNKPSTGSGLSLFSSGSSSSAGSSLNKPSTGSGSSLFSSGSSSSTGSLFNKPSTGSGSSLFSSGSSSSAGSSLNKPSTGSGSSFFSSGSSSSSGSSLNKPSTGSGSSLFSSGSSSSTGSLFNKPSTGSGSSLFSSGSSSSAGSSLNKPSTGSGSSLFSSGSSSSAGSSLNKPSTGSTGLGSSNKPTTNVKSSSTFGSSSSSTGSASKSSSSGSGLSSWWGLGGSSSSQSKPGSSTGKGPSTGTSSGGTGSLFGAGRTSGLGGGPVNVAQHIRDLQRIINPNGPEEKQDLSRMLG